MESRPAEQRRTLLRLEHLEADVTVTFCGCQECCDPHSWPLCFTLLCLLSHHFLAISLDLTLCLGLLLASDPSAENLFCWCFSVGIPGREFDWSSSAVYARRHGHSSLARFQICCLRSGVQP